MRLSSRIFNSIACLTFALTACSPATTPPGAQQVRELTWQALEPNTSSHDRANWEFVEVKQVSGHEVIDRFTGEPAPGCWQGPPPPENAAIIYNGFYWYVDLKPRSATPLPSPTEEFSPTAPPNILEPFLYRAEFLVDTGTGLIVARKLSCSVY